MSDLPDPIGPDPTSPDRTAPDQASAEAVSASAREWHKLQLGALAFVGLCGVLTGDQGTRLPMWLQSAAGVLVLLALATAAAGLLLVAVVAWPLGRPLAAETGIRRLRAGVGLTAVAVGLTALAASSSWWPSTSTGRPLEVETATGAACGRIVDSAAGWIDLDVGGEVVRVDLADVVSLAPREGC